ncbi:hypothetical protein ACL6C3_29315 [Capilliphycus salinus ALCB114379]|uniref:hypothetical protein n=1 Tax=Capilliphycus salinus TaxID=2768948 RepID=UPI0039A623FB
MAIALEKKVYNFVTLTASVVITSMGFNVVSSLNSYSNYTPENVIKEAVELNVKSSNRRPPTEHDGGSRWVSENKNNPNLRMKTN